MRYTSDVRQHLGATVTNLERVMRTSPPLPNACHNRVYSFARLLVYVARKRTPSNRRPLHTYEIRARRKNVLSSGV
jgi:hypothetical protein